MSLSELSNANIFSRFFDKSLELNNVTKQMPSYENKDIWSFDHVIEQLKDIIPDLNHMAELVKRKCSKISLGRLNFDQAAAIMLFTMEWTPEKPAFYLHLNTALRNENRKLLVRWNPYIRLLVNALMELPKIAGPVLYCGASIDVRNQYSEVDGKYTWSSFSACKSDQSHLNEYVNDSDYATIFEIQCQSAIDIKHYSFDQSNDEFILLPGREFCLIEQTAISNDRCCVKLKEITPSDPQFVFPENMNSMKNFVFCGEEGSGKRTLINSLINYWKYETFSDALAGESLVALPMSMTFLLEDSYEITDCTLHESDNISSVTVDKYRSFFWPTGKSDSTKINIIDIPSFQIDENDSTSMKNVESIVQYLSKYDKIDGLCVVVKSDEAHFARLPYYFQKLIEDLSPQILDRIFFFFTNTYSTLHTPGSSISVLNRMCQYSKTKLRVNKWNSFLFENQPFCALIFTKQNPNLITNSDIERIETEWSRSADEAKRFFEEIIMKPH